MYDRSVRLVVRCSILVGALLAWSAPALAAPTTSTGSTTTTTVPTLTASVTPSTGLSDLQTVTVTGSGFAPDHLINVAQCKLLDNVTSGVCYGPTRKSQMSDSSGAFSTTFIVRRIIVESGSSVDCASAPATCGIVAGDPRIAVATLVFDPSQPANGPKVVATPDSGLHDGDIVQIAGSGFTPNETVIIAQCAATTLGLTACDRTNDVTVTADEKGSLPASQHVVHSSIGIVGAPLDCLPATTDAAPCVIVAANAIAPSEFATATTEFTAPSSLPRTGSESLPLAIFALASVAGGAALVFGSRRRAAERT